MIRRFRYKEPERDINDIPDPVRGVYPQFDEKGRMRLSVSRMQVIAKCAKAFKFMYIEGLNFDDGNEYLELGKVVHDGVYKASLCRAPEQIRATEYYDKAPEHFENFIEFHNKLARDDGIVKPYAAEFEIMDYDDNVVLYIDRVNELPDGTYEVMDYKTGKAHGMPRHYFQLALYAYYFEKHTGKTVSKWSIFYTATGKCNSVEADRSRIEMIPDFVRLLRELQESYEKEDFPKRITVLCDWCQYKKMGICDGNGKLNKDPFGILDIYSKKWRENDRVGRAAMGERKPIKTILGGIRVI
jgi:CRISPR/Cas system-associated exonuclease Cas4 (RecB family)